MKKKYALITGGLIVAGILLYRLRRTIPKNAQAVKNFDKKKYLGRWYEIARLDYKYERHLNNTTAEYSLNNNGTIKVVNSGYDYEKNQWKHATGKAKFAGNETEGKLKVSLFGPFYAGYNVIDVDEDYNYAMVAGENLHYLWLMSRKPTLPDGMRDYFLFKAREIGYDTSQLVWVDHTM